MKRLLFSILIVGLTASNLVFADNETISAGWGLSTGVSRTEIGEKHIISLGLPVPNLDAEVNYKVSELFDLKLRGSAGFNLGNTKSVMHAEITPMVTGKISSKLALGAGVQLKTSRIGNGSTTGVPNNSNVGDVIGSTAIYGEARATIGRNSGMYVGVAKNIGDKGYDVKIGFIAPLSKQY